MAPGKSGLHAHGEGERVLALDPDRTGEVARAQGQEGEPEFIFITKTKSSSWDANNSTEVIMSGMDS